MVRGLVHTERDIRYISPTYCFIDVTAQDVVERVVRPQALKLGVHIDGRHLDSSSLSLEYS